MIKTIIICILVTLATAVPYSKWNSTKKNCTDTLKISGINGICQYNVFTNKITNPQCGVDFYKSLICETTFGKKCFNINAQEQYPLVCYQCWTKSPSSSSLYKQFQDCLQKNVWESALVGKLFFVMLLAFMYIL